MNDWSSNDLIFESTDRTTELVKPPFLAVGMTGVVVLLSLLCLLGNSTLGYGVSVIASIMGGVTALIDQKKRADSNYSSYDSFRYSLSIVRFAALAAAVLHIARLAINAANGGGIFG